MRSGRNLRDPFATRVGNEARRAVCRNAHYLAVFAAGQQRVVRLVDNEGQQPVMCFGRLVAVIEPVDRAGGPGEEGNILEESHADDVTFEIERSDGRHQLVRLSWLPLPGIMPGLHRP